MTTEPSAGVKATPAVMHERAEPKSEALAQHHERAEAEAQAPAQHESAESDGSAHQHARAAAESGSSANRSDMAPLDWREPATRQAQAYVDEWARRLKVAAEEVAVGHDSESVSPKHVIAAADTVLVQKGPDADAVADVLIAAGPLFVGIAAGFLCTVVLTPGLAVPRWLYVVAIIVLALFFGVSCVGATLKLKSR